MPPSRIANVGCLASTDLSVLPFLAPRLLPPSTAWTQTRRWNSGSSIQAEKETRETKRRIRSLGGQYHVGDGTPDLDSDAPERFPIPASINARKSVNQRQMSSHRRSRRFPLLHSLSLNTLPQYSEISSFIRSQIRNYTPTAEPSKTKLRRLILPSKAKPQHPYIRKQRSWLIRGSKACSGLAPYSKSTKTVNKSPVTRYSLQLRRLNAIRLTREQLGQYKSLLGGNKEQQKQALQISWVRLRQRRLIVLLLKRPKTLNIVKRKQEWRTFERIWMDGFAVLNRPFDPWLRYRSNRVRLRLHPKSEDWARDFYPSDISAEEQQKLWESLGRSKASIWPHILLYLLQKCPNRALLFLQVTNVHPFPPAIAVSDALEFLARIQVEKVKNTGAVEIAPSILSAFFNIYQSTPSEFGNSISQELVHLLLAISSPEEARTLYGFLYSKNVQLRWYTLLHFASAFGKGGEYELGLDALKKGATAEAVVSTDIFKQSCTSVIRGSVIGGNSYHATSDIVAGLLQMGVRFNIHLYTVIIHNAVEAGDIQMAFRVFNLLEENGVAPNSFTYSILLQGCKESDNPETFQDFANHCAQMAKELKDPWLATEYMHYLYVCQQRRNNRYTLKILTEAYCQFFSPRPLIDMKILAPTFASETWIDRMAPCCMSLYLIIATDLQCRGEETSDAQLYRIYWRFRELVQIGHPHIAQLAEKPHIYNAFLAAFCSRESMLKNATQVIRDMTTELIPTAVHERGQHRISPALPDVYSWTIFMNGFVRFRQMAAAERVLGLMKKRNLEPTNITWSTLLRGYAQAQNLEKIGEVMRSVQEHGIILNTRTLHDLGQIQDRKGLMSALEQSAETQQAKLDNSELEKRWRRTGTKDAEDPGKGPQPALPLDPNTASHGSVIQRDVDGRDAFDLNSTKETVFQRATE